MARRVSVGDSDETLIADVMRYGSPMAARRLVDRHSPRLLAIAVRMLGGDVAAAEDVLQQSWINAIGALPRFRGDAAFATWMTRIVIRTAIDALRGRRGLDLADESLLADIAAPSDDCDERLDVERSIARLPAGCRAVLIAHDLEGFTHEEIAATLRIATGTSKAHLFRARRLLRGWLTQVPAQEAQRNE